MGDFHTHFSLNCRTDLAIVNFPTFIIVAAVVTV